MYLDFRLYDAFNCALEKIESQMYHSSPRTFLIVDLIVESKIYEMTMETLKFRLSATVFIVFSKKNRFVTTPEQFIRFASVKIVLQTKVLQICVSMKTQAKMRTLLVLCISSSILLLPVALLYFDGSLRSIKNFFEPLFYSYYQRSGDMFHP